MVTDTAFPYDTNQTGDTDTVSGTDFYLQHAQILGLLVSDRLKGNPTSANEITEFESAIVQQFRASQYFSEPISAQVQSVTDGEITVRVQTNEIQTELGL